MIPLTFFDLFSGIGGFRLGLEREGYKCVGFCEINKYATKLYKAYFNTEGEVEYHDAREIIPEELPDFDVLTAGFPCQAFSIAGKKRGFNDSRGSLFFEIIRIAKIKKPTYLFLENVKEILTHDRGRTFTKILLEMDKLGYNAEWQMLSSDRFGVPQSRKRVFIVGHHRKRSKLKVFPITEKDKVYYQKPIKQPINAIIKACYTPKRKKEYVRGRKFRNFDEPMYTLTAKGATQGIIIESTENIRIRILTPLEYFRLQGFPDDMVTIAQKLGFSDSCLYYLAGNSVTVQIVQTIAKKLKRS